MGSKRLGYRKSRMGCLRCKKRRVKCDECAPCGACQRHDVPCSLDRSYRYAPEKSLSPAATSSRADTTQPVRKLEEDGTTKATTAHPPFLLLSSPKAMPADYGACWISDAELMHHYATVAYRTLSFSAHVAPTLQVDVPREAISHPFFLHEILAFSAFHLAYLYPSKRNSYILQASRHQSLAISGMRDALAASINAGNCHAIFATSLFLIMSAFAAFPSYEHRDCPKPIEALIDIFSLVSGLGGIFRSSEEDLLAGPLKGIFSPYPYVGSTDAVDSLLGRLPELRKTLSELPSSNQDTTQTLTASADALLFSITALRKNGALGAPTEIRSVFFWPMLVSPGFLDLARSEHAAALVVLAHYMVLIHMSEPHCWFLGSWARHLVDDLAIKLSGSSWIHVVNWAIDLVQKGHPKPSTPN